VLCFEWSSYSRNLGARSFSYKPLCSTEMPQLGESPEIKELSGFEREILWLPRRGFTSIYLRDAAVITMLWSSFISATGADYDSRVGPFSPTTIGAINVSNRIVMAPLTRARAGMDGVPSPLAVEYYRQRASAGLIISEATNVSQQGRGYAFTPGIYTDAHVKGWRPVTQAVHDVGGRMVLQLWHVGRMSHTSLQENGTAPVAPSAIQAGEEVFIEKGPAAPSMPRALETDEIPGIIEDYRNAARKANEAGFDGVEVHCANCYLLTRLRLRPTRRVGKWLRSPVHDELW